MYTSSKLEGMSNWELWCAVTCSGMMNEAERSYVFARVDPWEKVKYSRDEMIEYLSCLSKQDVETKLEQLEAAHDEYYYMSDVHSTYMSGSEAASRIRTLKNTLEKFQ